MTAINSIAIFGGTFDPFHNGHLHLIDELLKSKRFSKIIVVPAGNPWQKSPSASPRDRWEMTKVALKDVNALVSDCEVKRGAPSYAIDTVYELQKLDPHSAFTWIVGSDAISGLATWNRIEEMATKVEFLFVIRPGHLIDESQIPTFIKWNSIEIDALDISATQVRELASTGSDISALVPASVAKYIQEKGLYGAA